MKYVLSIVFTLIFLNVAVFVILLYHEMENCQFAFNRLHNSSCFIFGRVQKYFLFIKNIFNFQALWRNFSYAAENLSQVSITFLFTKKIRELFYTTRNTSKIRPTRLNWGNLMKCMIAQNVIQVCVLRSSYACILNVVFYIFALPRFPFM